MVPASIVCCEVLALGVFERVFQFRASTALQPLICYGTEDDQRKHLSHFNSKLQQSLIIG